jgi:DNA-binding protein HU-beta
MNKLELVEYIASVAKLPKGVANRALETALLGIAEALGAQEEVVLAGFGILSVQERTPRVSRDPYTGEIISIKAKKIINFKAGKALENRVKDPILSEDADLTETLNEGVDLSHALSEYSDLTLSRVKSIDIRSMTEEG